MPEISPKWDYFPFMSQLAEMIGGIQAVAFVISVGVLIVGIIMLIVAKVSDSNALQSKGAGVVITILVGIGLLGTAVGLAQFAFAALTS